ncbi:MAG: radical SAM protein [Magnetococcales bacterium]|nr:radical SAM protein [Magnetococcales bacterium]
MADFPPFPDYDDPLYRPPSEGDNLIIQATIGCGFNQCTFCSMYHSKRFAIKPLAATFADIDQAAQIWPHAHRVFLADGDALCLPTDHLLEILVHLKKRLPKLTRVSCYATPGDLLKKSLSELETLKNNKLTLLYYGIESGYDLLLKIIRKGANQQSMIEGLQKAAQAGLKVSATVVLGLGGQTLWQPHIDHTVTLLEKAPVHYLSTLQLMLAPAIKEAFLSRFDPPFVVQEDDAILEEQKRLLSGLTTLPRRIIFRSNHASNALALAGTLPKDRERLLAEIEACQTDDDTRLRPFWLRSL